MEVSEDFSKVSQKVVDVSTIIVSDRITLTHYNEASDTYDSKYDRVFLDFSISEENPGV